MSQKFPEAERLGVTEPYKNWKKWGPYLAERQWGTVREDYSKHGDAWNFVDHEKARSNAYRWGEEGIGGFCDNREILCLAPAFWNGIDHIEDLELPGADRNIIVTVHYYHPMDFTHQGAPWSSHRDVSDVEWLGAPDEQQAIIRDFNKVQTWAEQQQRPIFLGEFGAYDKADMASRARYTSYVARQAEKLGWSWSYWQFDSDFIVYDIDEDCWVEPILQALIPPEF